MLVLVNFIKPLLAARPSLREIYIRGGKGENVQAMCHMTQQSISFVWKALHANVWQDWSVSFCPDGEMKLEEEWAQFWDHSRHTSSSFDAKCLGDAIATTPIKTSGEIRTKKTTKTRSTARRVKAAATPSLPVRLFKKDLPIDVRWNANEALPELYFLPSNRWVPWDAVLHSDRMLEDRGKRYIVRVLQLLDRRVMPTGHISGEYGHKWGQSAHKLSPKKLIKPIWQLKWEDRRAKVDALKQLCRLRG